MNKKTLLFWILVVLVIGAYTLPVFPDPYYHDEKVTFAEWVYREIDELFTGERE